MNLLKKLIPNTMIDGVKMPGSLKVTAQNFRKPIKVKLLNNGGHLSLLEVKFPVVVFCNFIDRNNAFIKSEELIKHGADINDCKGMEWLFEIGKECEVIEE